MPISTIKSHNSRKFHYPPVLTVKYHYGVQELSIMFAILGNGIIFDFIEK